MITNSGTMDETRAGVPLAVLTYLTAQVIGVLSSSKHARSHATYQDVPVYLECYTSLREQFRLCVFIY